jgi:hypothetical protein
MLLNHEIHYVFIIQIVTIFLGFPVSEADTLGSAREDRLVEPSRVILVLFIQIPDLGEFLLMAEFLEECLKSTDFLGVVGIRYVVLHLSYNLIKVLTILDEVLGCFCGLLDQIHNGLLTLTLSHDLT